MPYHLFYGVSGFIEDLHKRKESAAVPNLGARKELKSNAKMERRKDAVL